MMYIIMFIISIALYYLSIKYEKDKKKSNLLFVFSILTPCVLAALRGFLVGTDIKMYVKPLFDASYHYENIFEYMKGITNVNDPLYIILTYICAKIFNSFGVLLFLCELLVVAPLFVAIRKKYKYQQRGLIAVILFFLFFYNQSLNIVRQSIAISFIILAQVFLEEKNDKNYFICSIIATLFHSSGIIFILLYILYKMLNSDFKYKEETKKIIVFSLIIVFILLPQLIKILPHIIFLSKYHIYATQYVREKFEFAVLNSVMYASTFAYLYYYNKQEKCTNEYYIFGSLLSFIVLQYGGLVMGVDRICYYLYYPIVFLGLPTVFGKQNIKKDSKYKFILLGIYIAYWLLSILILNHHETLPFVIR